MAFIIRGRVKGDKEVAKALAYAPEVYFGALRTWLKKERVKIVGTKKSTKGYKRVLANKRRRNRDGTWSTQVTGLFKGHIPHVNKIGDLSLKTGILGKSKHQLRRALEMMQAGGVITSSKQMPVPVYKNLAKIGYHGPWSRGSVYKGMTSKAFAFYNRVKFADEGRQLVAIKNGGRTLYFDKNQRTKTGRFPRSALLFMGLHKIRIKRQFIGRYDLYARFDRMVPASIKRGQTAVDKATRIVERKMK